MIKITCPHCGWVRGINMETYEEIGSSIATRSLAIEAEKFIESIKRLLTNNTIENTNAWIDMPPCPSCNKSFRYNAKTNEAKQ